MSSTTSTEQVGTEQVQQYERFYPSKEYGAAGPRPGSHRDFMHTRIRTDKASMVWSTWWHDREHSMGLLTWYDYEESDGAEYHQALVSIKVMQAWFALFDAITQLAKNSTQHDPDSFEVGMMLPMMMLTDGEVETINFGVADDVLYTGHHMLIQPKKSRFVPIVDTKCCSCNEDMDIDSLFLGGLNEGTWAPIRKDGDSKWGYVPYCTPCSDAVTAEMTEALLRPWDI